MGGRFSADVEALRHAAARARNVHAEASEHAPVARCSDTGHAALQSAAEQFASHAMEAISYRKALISDLAERLDRNAGARDTTDRRRTDHFLPIPIPFPRKPIFFRNEVGAAARAAGTVAKDALTNTLGTALNDAASFGNALANHPDKLLETLGGAGLIAGGDTQATEHASGDDAMQPINTEEHQPPRQPRRPRSVSTQSNHKAVNRQQGLGIKQAEEKTGGQVDRTRARAVAEGRNPNGRYFDGFPEKADDIYPGAEIKAVTSRGQAPSSYLTA